MMKPPAHVQINSGSI